MARRRHSPRSLAAALTARSARALGYELHRRDYFYGPLPDLERLPQHLWDGPRPLHGVDLGVPAALAWIEGALRPFLEEFRGPRGPLAGGYTVPNGFYGGLDSAILYAIVRARRPARVIELGSGNSSLLIAAALAMNAEEGASASYRIFDPYPFEGGGRVPPPALAQIERLAAEDVALSHFEALQASDVLFVDTTHTVKTGGDVVRIVLEILPVLAPGVAIHFHDVFLPFEYPRSWLYEFRRAWAEQYLLAAFLSDNPRFRVLMPCYAVGRAEPGRIAALVRDFDAGIAPPAAFWIERR